MHDKILGKHSPKILSRLVKYPQVSCIDLGVWYPWDTIKIEIEIGSKWGSM